MSPRAAQVRLPVEPLLDVSGNRHVLVVDRLPHVRKRRRGTCC